MTIKTLKAESLKGINHAFFTRQGGVSKGIYDSLNVGRGSQDNPQHVAKNRASVQQAMGAEQLVTLHQCHSAEVVIVNEMYPQKEFPKADAMVTTEKGLALGILTADCAPVLFADPVNQVIGAAHSGWKGAFGGVIENTLGEMEKLGAQRSEIIAVIGPAIGKVSYQVDTLFHAQRVSEHGDSAPFFERDINSASHYLFDLKGYVHHRLTAAKIGDCEIMPHNTYNDESGFFSYRRSCHRNEPDYGRQISAIML